MLARAEEEYPLSIPQPGWAEQDPEDWWRASERALAAVGAGDAASVGLTGQMHGLVLLDAADRVLRPAILWNDQRTAAECAEIEERIGLERLIELTGNRALTGFTAPKLLWVRRHEPELWAQAAHILLPKDYVRLRLTGERAIDAAEASGTLLFDVAGRRWSEEVCEALEVPLEWLPAAHESTEIGGAGDQQAGALGVGVAGPGPVSVVLGTSGVVFAALARVPARAGGPPARLLPRRARDVGGDGRDAVGRRVAALAARRRRRRVRAARRRGGALARGDRGADVPAVPPGRADAARRSVRAGGVRGTVPAPRPRRARPRRPRGSRLRAARLARAAARARRRARRRPRLGRRGAQPRSGSRSSPPCSGSRSSGRRSRRAPPTARRCSAESPPASSPTRRRRSRPACACATRSIPTRSGSSVYEDGYRRFRALYPALRRPGGAMTLEGKAAFVTGASRGIGAAVARALSAAGVSVGLASRSGDDLGLERSIGARLQRRRPGGGGRRGRGHGRAVRPARHPGRERRRRRLRAVPRALARAPRGDDRRQPEGDAVRGRGGAAAPARAAARRTSSRSPPRPGRRGLPYEAVYCASKFGQVGFTRALDHELREQGVRCTNVCPGGVATDFALDEGRGRTPDVLPGMMTRRERGRGGHVRPHPAAQPPDPRDRVPPDDRDRAGVSRAGVQGLCPSSVGRHRRFPARAPPSAIATTVDASLPPGKTRLRRRTTASPRSQSRHPSAQTSTEPPHPRCQALALSARYTWQTSRFVVLME